MRFNANQICFHSLLNFGNNVQIQEKKKKSDCSKRKNTKFLNRKIWIMKQMQPKFPICLVILFSIIYVSFY